MEKASKDIIILIALELNISDITKLCSTSKRTNNIICANNVFWRNKLNKDYPQTIGKFPNNVNFRKIYLSLLNKETHVYYLFMTSDDDIPFVYPYIKKTPLLEEDYLIGEKLYPDFNDRYGQEEIFTVQGNFPTGTKIWLAICTDYDMNIKKGFLTCDEAIKELVENIFSLIEYDFEFVEDFVQDFENRLGVANETPEKFYGGNLQQVKNDIVESLKKNHHFEVTGHDNRRSNFLFPIHLAISEIMLS